MPSSPVQKAQQWGVSGPPLLSPSSSSSWRHKPAVYLPLVALALFGAISGLRTLDPAGGFPSFPSGFGLPRGGGRHARLSTYDLDLQPSPSSSSSYGPGEAREFDCEPFSLPGRLWVDLPNPARNGWKPYDRSCPPSSYMAQLRSAVLEGGADQGQDMWSPTPGQGLEWLRNRTVVIHGDSIDRFHLKDFCELVGGRLFLVPTGHEASPPAWREHMEPLLDSEGKETLDSRRRREERRRKEERWEARTPEAQQLTSPWVCDVEKFGFTMVNVFTWGLQGAEKYFESERWYHAPATWTDRLQAITLPLLPLLAEHLNRPSILHPDLIELNSGYWDLRRFAEEDFSAVGMSRPYPEDSPVAYTPLSREREAELERDLRRGIKAAARAFPGRKGETRDGPTLLWRTLHHPLKHNYAPYNRVAALDGLQRHVISSLRREGAFPSSSSSSSSSGDFSRHLAYEAEDEDEDLGLDERLRIDEIGALMIGQEHLFRDLLHPRALPGSWVWGDVILYELKRAVSRVKRSS